MLTLNDIRTQLGDKASYLLDHQCLVPASQIHHPSPNIVREVFADSNRTPQVLRSIQSLYGHGRLANTGYLSILPVDQNIEHSAGASFAPNPAYFDPENIIKLAIDGGCSTVASTLGILGLFSRKYAHKIPFTVKINHNEFLSYPNKYDQTLFGTVEDAWNMGATAVGATIYFGSLESARQITEISQAFARAHELGMATVLRCYTRNSAFKKNDIDYGTAGDLTGQANHIGVTIQADIIKQKAATTNESGYKALQFGRYHEKMYTDLSSDHPIDLGRYQVLNCYNGRIGLVNAGGESKGESDLRDVITTAVINKRAGGHGLIAGRKAFQKPTDEGINLLHSIQDVYLCKDITLA